VLVIQLNAVHFDDFTIYHGKTNVIYSSNYYPFGLSYSEFNRSFSQKTKYKFQKQELDESTGWYAFKWRNHDPTIGRFFNIDPLSEKYLYNSTYAFSENKVVAHVELEGLESWRVNAEAIGTSTEKEKYHSSNQGIETHVERKNEQSAQLSFEVDMTGQVHVMNGTGTASAEVKSEKNIDGVEITTIKVDGEVGTGENTSKFTLYITTETKEKPQKDETGEMNSGSFKASGMLITGEGTNSAKVIVGGVTKLKDDDNPMEIVSGNQPSTKSYGWGSTKFYWLGHNKKDYSSGTTLRESKRKNEKK
jgi:RHS repeat-associated protein